MKSSTTRISSMAPGETWGEKIYVIIKTCKRSVTARHEAPEANQNDPLITGSNGKLIRIARDCQFSVQSVFVFRLYERR